MTKVLINGKAGEPATDGYQDRVGEWMLACFGAEITADRTERCHRFLEEALELVQALGATRSESHQLVDYVFGRQVGEPRQEVGGVMVTLAALCGAVGIDMARAGEDELARAWTKIDEIRAKQAEKPKHSPLPAALAPGAMTIDISREAVAKEASEWRAISDDPSDIFSGAADMLEAIDAERCNIGSQLAETERQNADLLAANIRFEKRARETERDASRYRWLRERDLETVYSGGVFIGETPRNMVLNLEDADAAIDVAMAAERGEPRR